MFKESASVGEGVVFWWGKRHIVGMTSSKPKRPRDINQRAKSIVDLATMDDEERVNLKKQIEKKAKRQNRSRVTKNDS